MIDSGAEAKADRQFVTSLARGLGLLAAFRADDRVLSNQELASRTGLPRPTVSRFTHTLRKLGYLAYHADTGSYSMTPRVIELSRTAIVSSGIRDIARPAMEALAEVGPLSVALGIPNGQSIRYLEMARQPEAIVLNLDVGALVPALQTAIGRAYLADLPGPKRREVLAQIEASDPALFAEQEAELQSEISGYAERGFVRSFGGWWPELSAVATVIRVVDDGDPLLLSVSGLSSVLTPERVESEYAAALLNAAHVIQGRMRRLLQS